MRRDGNRNLALVSLAGSFRSKSRLPHIRDKDYAYWLTNKALGRQSIVAVLRNQDGVWRVVAITDDPFNTNRQGILTVLGFGDLLDDSPAGSVAPEPARLITREGARLRTPVGFADFFWRPSPGSEVVGEVAEFLVQTSSTRERTRLFFLTGNEGRLSSGRIWGLLGRWRVWSISRDGMVSFTEHRSYRN